MADDSSGFFSNLRSYANEYIETKRRNLQAKPQTQVEGGGSGTEIQAESDDLEQWLQENVGPVDDLALDLGEDALWYPYGLAETVETRRGEFSHIECIEPWTMLPRTDEFGDITRWEQHLKGDFANPPTFDPEEIGSIIINKSSGRDKTGISEALRSQEEIETFRANQQAMREATERIGYPFVHAQAGREGATQLNDNELRRIRNRLADIGPGETQVTGPDVDINLKEPATVDFGEIQERDMRMLATSLGVPVELLNHGSDGLGSGMPAELRKDLLALQNEADRRRFSEQFVEDILRPIVRDYSPFDHTQDMEVVFDPFLDDKTDMASLIQSVGEYMTANEARDRLGLSDLEDEEMGESFRTPEDIESPDDQPDGGLFGSAAEEAVDNELENRDLGDPMANGHDMDPGTGEVTCATAGESFTIEEATFNDLAEDCPLCGEPLSHIDESQLSDSKDLAEIPDKYTEDTGLSEDNFVPNESILDVIEPTMEFIDQEGLPNPDDQQEGAARINQLKDHIDNNEPLEPEFWEEIANFHARHRAQDNHICDESSLPEKAEESDFDKCHFDNGWFSDRTWGGDPAFEQAQRIVESIEDTEGVELSGDVPDYFLAGDTDFRDSVETDGWEAWEHTLFELHQQAFEADGDVRLANFTERALPDFVKDRLQESIMQGAIFSQFDTLVENDIMQLREFMTEELTQNDGWTTDSIAGRLMDLESELTRDEAERIARTETASIVNSAREDGYEEQGLTEGEEFYWSGSLGDRTTAACEWLINKTNPNHGGNPVSLEKLKELIEEAPKHDDEMQDNLARPEDFVVHPNERKTWVRAV